VPAPPNHRQVEAFRIAMRVGSATAAADALHITQPAVSRLIADLERHVGFMLFERRKRGLQPTKDALLLFEEVDRSFRGLDRIAETADAIRSRRIGHLRVIALHSYSDGIVYASSWRVGPRTKSWKAW
jgi:DNA-binding transcriptional LysR family regulator